jgi:ArsR family transcriptional regulator
LWCQSKLRVWRCLVLEWLRNPREHFPPQKYGDLVSDGVCGVFIAEKLGISQSTASRHMKELTDAGLVREADQAMDLPQAG